MPGELDPIYIRARSVLLDAFQALGPHLDAITLVGAQAIYMHTREGDLAVAPYTTDGDLARRIAAGLSEEELALFDILTKPDPTLAKKQEIKVKKVVRELLDSLKREKLVLDWRKRQQSRQAVRLCIEVELDRLPRVYTPEIYERKCDLAYRHVYESYFGEGRSVYGDAA